MAAWRDMADEWHDRDEAYGQHVRVEAGYPDWNGSLQAVDEVAGTALPLPPSLPSEAAPEGCAAGSSPAQGHLKDAA